MGSPLQDEVGGNSHDDAPVWSDPLTHFGHFWDELPELVQEFYNSTIPDLDQSSWDDDDSSIWDDAYSPTPFDFSWSDLTDEQQELGRRIGYTEWSWEGEAGCMPRKKSLAFWWKKEMSCADLTKKGQCKKELLCSWDWRTTTCSHMCGGAGVPEKECKSHRFKGKKVCRYVSERTPMTAWPTYMPTATNSTPPPTHAPTPPPTHAPSPSPSPSPTTTPSEATSSIPPPM